MVANELIGIDQGQDGGIATVNTALARRAWGVSPRKGFHFYLKAPKGRQRPSRDPVGCRPFGASRAAEVGMGAWVPGLAAWAMSLPPSGLVLRPTLRMPWGT